jgi:hypothetical protein
MIEALNSLAAFDKVAGTSFAGAAPTQKAMFSPLRSSRAALQDFRRSMTLATMARACLMTWRFAS